MSCYGCCGKISPTSPDLICIIDYWGLMILLAILTLSILVFPPMYLMGKFMQYLERRKEKEEEVT